MSKPVLKPFVLKEKDVLCCCLCSYESKGKNGMRLHMKYSHSINKSTSETKEYCTFCKKFFPENQVRQHVYTNK